MHILRVCDLLSPRGETGQVCVYSVPGRTEEGNTLGSIIRVSKEETTNDSVTVPFEVEQKKVVNDIFRVVCLGSSREDTRRAYHDFRSRLNRRRKHLGSVTHVSKERHRVTGWFR